MTVAQHGRITLKLVRNRNGATIDPYTTIRAQVSAEIDEKKSRFIAVAAPVAQEADALALLEGVRAQHRMARHHVFAYVLGGAKEGRRVRYSDDGEPSRTAGLPVLEVIEHAGLTNVIVVVTRYFGGVLLGTGGLVRAYTQTAQAALAKAELVSMRLCVDLHLRIAYADYDRVIYVLNAMGAKVVESSFTELVHLHLRVLAEDRLAVRDKLVELLRGDEGLSEGEPYLGEF